MTSSGGLVWSWEEDFCYCYTHCPSTSNQRKSTLDHIVKHFHGSVLHIYIRDIVTSWFGTLCSNCSCYNKSLYFKSLVQDNYCNIGINCCETRA